MVKVYTVEKARKADTKFNIVVGDKYYYWTPGWRGRTIKSKTYPKQSQLTANEFLQTVLGAGEQLDNFSGGLDDLRELGQSVRDAGEEVRGSFDNMPEGLQQGETGQLLERRADAAGTWADKFDEVCDDLEPKLEAVGKLRELKTRYDSVLEEAGDESDNDDVQENLKVIQTEADAVDLDDTDLEDWDGDETESELISAAVEEINNEQPDWD